MKCERCGHQLEDVDLFCPRCGKAVFEEYMDDDDIWEHYKPDEELITQEETAAATEEKTEKVTESGETSAEVKAEMPPRTESERPESKETGMDDEEVLSPHSLSEDERSQDAEPEEEPSYTDRPVIETPPVFAEKPERAKQARQRKSTNAPVNNNGKKDPIWLICGCILLVCLIIGVMMGLNSFKKEDVEKESYYARFEEDDKKDMPGESGENQQGGAGEPKDEEVPEEKPKEEEQQTADEQKAFDEQQKKEEEPKKQEYFQMVDAGSIDFSQFSKVPVASTEQNSMSSSEKYDYSADSAVDGDASSSWQEGEEGLGDGTGIKMNLDGNHKVRYLVLYLGNWRSENMWNANARPAVLSISVGDSQKKDVEFSNEMKAFCLSFDEPVEASYVSMYIQSGYGGDRWNDNCISEVEIYE